jgi:hypothetical protein
VCTSSKRAKPMHVARSVRGTLARRSSGGRETPVRQDAGLSWRICQLLKDTPAGTQNSSERPSGASARFVESEFQSSDRSERELPSRDIEADGARKQQPGLTKAEASTCAIWIHLVGTPHTTRSLTIVARVAPVAQHAAWPRSGWHNAGVDSAQIGERAVPRDRHANCMTFGMSRRAPGWSTGVCLLWALVLTSAACSSAHGSEHLEPSADIASDARACRTSADCAPAGNGPWGCIGPNEPVRCGPVLPGEHPADCRDDSQCGREQVCRRDPAVPTGWLGASGLVCAAPCASDHDCAPTDACEDSGHCRTRTCDECPEYLSCASGACVIPNCSADRDCPGGYCVQGACAGALGTCTQLCF